MNIDALNFVNKDFKPVYYSEKRRDCHADKFIYYKHGSRSNGFHRCQYLDSYSPIDIVHGKHFLYKKVRVK